MRYLSLRKIFYIPKHVFVLILLALVIVPFDSLGQEVQDSQSSESQSSESQNSESNDPESEGSETNNSDSADSNSNTDEDSDTDSPDADENSNQDTEETEDNDTGLGDETGEIDSQTRVDDTGSDVEGSSETDTATDTEVDSATGEVLGESTPESSDDDLDEELEVITEEDKEIIEEETLIEEFIEEIEEMIYDVPEIVVTRIFKKDIVIDQSATHSCQVETFRVDISDKSSETALILLNKSADMSYEVEIGSLPIGIDVYFAKNELYKYNVASSDTSLELKIIKKNDSQKGDFTIPIFYTQKGINKSSVICQINIVNQ